MNSGDQLKQGRGALLYVLAGLLWATNSVY